MATDVAFDTDHESVELWPDAIDAGDAAKLVTVGGDAAVETVTVAVALALPDEFVAVSVYVVVVDGETVRDPEAETLPIP